MTSTTDRLVHDYLAALESAAAGLPPDARRTSDRWTTPEKLASRASPDRG